MNFWIGFGCGVLATCIPWGVAAAGFARHKREQLEAIKRRRVRFYVDELCIYDGTVEMLLLWQETGRSLP